MSSSRLRAIQNIQLISTVCCLAAFATLRYIKPDIDTNTLSALAFTNLMGLSLLPLKEKGMSVKEAIHDYHTYKGNFMLQLGFLSAAVSLGFYMGSHSSTLPTTLLFGANIINNMAKSWLVTKNLQDFAPDSANAEMLRPGM